MASSRNLLPSSDPNSYGSDDAFDTYIDMDFLRNDTMEEDIDIGNMSTSDLFRYYLEGELAKDPANLDSEAYATTMQNAEDFSLATSPVSISEEPKPNPIDVVEETNVLPQPTNVSTAVGPSLAILNAQLAELLAKLPIIKRETIVDNKVTMLSGSSTPENSTFSNLSTASKPSTVPNNAESDQKQIDDNSQIDLKKLSSKERRQLRNKISARNFRVRRKEYIQSLESTKEQQQEEINLLRQALLHLQEENNKLQQEVEELRKQKQNKVFINPPPSPPHNPSLTTKDITNSHAFSKNGNTQRSNSIKASQNHQPPSPDSRYLIIPNVNKDTSPSSSSAGKKTWQDSRVRVQTTFVPEFNLDKHLFGGKSDFPYSSFWNIATNGQPIRLDLLGIGSSETTQKTLFVYMLFSTIMQRLATLFVEAVCATPHHLMISALFPKAVCAPKISVEGHHQSPEIDDKKSSESNEIHCQPSDSLSLNNKNSPSRTNDAEEPLLDNNTVVESIKEASVLDWLYDSMVKHVVEQSQMEARMTELSDWVGEEWDDNVLPFLF